LSPLSTDRLLLGGLRASAALAAATVLFIVAFVLNESIPVLQHAGVMRFVTDASWHPTAGLYNLLPMLAGTVLVTLGSVLVATPLGVVSAIFCNHYAPPRVAGVYRGMIEILAGIPSVVYGLWGLLVLVPLIGSIEPPGASLLAGIAILTLMIVPTVTLIADSSIAAVPAEHLRGAAALGLTRVAIVRQVVLPAARPGILSGVFLASARAIGETMAVLMVCGNVVQVPNSLFDPVRTLTANIALEMAYAMDDHRAALFVTALALTAMIVVLVLTAEFAGKPRSYA